MGCWVAVWDGREKLLAPSARSHVDPDPCPRGTGLVPPLGRGRVRFRLPCCPVVLSVRISSEGGLSVAVQRTPWAWAPRMCGGDRDSVWRRIGKEVLWSGRPAGHRARRGFLYTMVGGFKAPASIRGLFRGGGMTQEPGVEVLVVLSQLGSLQVTPQVLPAGRPQPGPQAGGPDEGHELCTGRGSSLSPTVPVHSVSKYSLSPCHVPDVATAQMWSCPFRPPVHCLVPERCDGTARGGPSFGEGRRCVFFFFMLLSFIIFLADKATDPSVSEQDWSAIQNFCDQVNTDPNG